MTCQVLPSELLVAVSPKRLLMDQMKDKYARIIFSAEVQDILEELGYVEEVRFVRLVRNALIVACDSPGVIAKERYRYLLEFDRYSAKI